MQRHGTKRHETNMPGMKKLEMDGHLKWEASDGEASNGDVRRVELGKGTGAKIS